MNDNENEKLKSISLSKLKISEPSDETKERRVTFVASTAKEDRDYEVVEIETFRLPLKGGGHIQVSDLPTGGSENVDIPFLTNHNLWSVENTIGSVRNAKFVDGQLIFECGISSREYAQDMFKLIEEGHLDNAYSIQFRDYEWNPDSDHISKGEIVEVSLVTRGSNKDAQTLEVKAVKGESMDEMEDIKKKSTDATATQDGAADSPNQVAENTTTPEVDDSKTEDTTKGEDDATDSEPEKADDTPRSTENETKGKSMNGETNHKDIAAEQAANQMKMPSQEMTNIKVSGDSDYLKSKQAENDFARIVYDNYNRNGDAVKKAWANHVKEKGISGDEIYPTNFASLFFKGWEDHYEAMATFQRTNLLSGYLYAWQTTDRAQGNKKGDKKIEQNVTDIRRDYSSVMMYKMLGIYQEDLISDHGGELLRMRTEDLNGRMGDEAVRAIIFGDGRTAPTAGQPDYRLFRDGKGAWSMVNDITKSANATANPYSAAVATQLAYDEKDTLYKKFVKTLAAVKGGRGRKVLVTKEGATMELALETDADGRLLFAPGTNFQNILGDIYIFESPYMEGSGYDVIAYREGSYFMALGDMIIRGAFDLHYNTDMLIMERMLGGSLYGHKVAAGYQSKA